MRTTLDIEHDVLLAVAEVARLEGKSLGSVISALARRTLAQEAREPAPTQPPPVPGPLAAYGIHPLPARGALVTNELIDRLRERQGV
ncbi:hypothetical protein [Ramlibacter sp. WS9]|uniref:hypothetical protein n=1 Tax=Ramlibacter sp. WS9 TaxID=1882741 RepID=UPI001142D7D7|nr:hypothetical protein [Ramlibacter sp. WS9]ROZ79162.1 hypothetical protein EEB15_05690 [Ramlibacter sp. WS9]